MNVFIGFDLLPYQILSILRCEYFIKSPSDEERFAEADYIKYNSQLYILNKRVRRDVRFQKCIL